jgi:hypothetical protein
VPKKILYGTSVHATRSIRGSGRLLGFGLTPHAGPAKIRRPAAALLSALGGTHGVELRSDGGGVVGAWSVASNDMMNAWVERTAGALSRPARPVVPGDDFFRGDNLFASSNAWI